MTTLSRRTFGAALASLAAGPAGLAATGRARAQAWPERNVTMIVPFPAGASTDVVARLVGEELRTKLGQGFIVENKVGAGGNIAASGVVRAAPDGYTLFMSSSGPLSSNKLLYKTLTYDPITDFEPISLVGDVQCIVAVHRSLPVSTLAELIAYGKANPGKLTFGSPGYGLMGHIAGELIQRTAGFQMTHVPYRGSAPLSNDLVAGNVNVAVDFLPPYIPHVKAGSIKAIAVTSDRRAPQIPDAPTLAEAGMPGINVTSWFALAGPKGVPQPIVQKLSQAISAYVRTPEATAKLEQIGVRAVGGSPDDLRKAQAAEIAKWAGVIREAGISLE
jgi:tripartite-type tricarboxylate transporter receptor subunit TctC